jgi:hypothetical protein
MPTAEQYNASHGVGESKPIESAPFYLHSVDYWFRKLQCLLREDELKDLETKIHEHLKK